MDKVLMEVTELAEYMNCSKSLIRKLLREGKIPHIRLYRKILFDKASINEWLDEKQNHIKPANNEYYGLKVLQKKG